MLLELLEPLPLLLLLLPRASVSCELIVDCKDPATAASACERRITNSGTMCKGGRAIDTASQPIPLQK